MSSPRAKRAMAEGSIDLSSEDITFRVVASRSRTVSRLMPDGIQQVQYHYVLLERAGWRGWLHVPAKALSWRVPEFLREGGARVRVE